MVHTIDRSPLYGLESSNGLTHDGVLGFSPDRLTALVRQDKAYQAFVRITGGKRRAVKVPVGDLAEVHDRLFDLLDRIEKPDYLYSGVKGRSHVANARAHLGKEPMVKLDIRKFFPSIDVPRVHRFFSRQLACAAPISDLLTGLCTFRGQVPIGSRMSQHLAYFAAKPMLDDLYHLSARHKVIFTCYVDDLTFSGAAATPSFLWRVKQVVHHHRFKYHNDLCYKAGDRKIVTGVVVAGDRLAVLPRHAQQIRQDEIAIDTLSPDARRRALERLIGRMAAAGNIEPSRRKALRKLVSEAPTMCSGPVQLAATSSIDC